jgi:hypothetical protein
MILNIIRNRMRKLFFAQVIYKNCHELQPAP